MNDVLNKTTQEGCTTEARQRAAKGSTIKSRERAQNAALNRLSSLAYGLFLAGRHREACQKDFRVAVQQYKDVHGFKGRFDKDSDEWNAMLVATDAVYRRLEIARHLEKHIKGLLTKAWRDAELNADEADFWGMSARMQVDAPEFLRAYRERNYLIAADARDAGLADEEVLRIRRADANAQAASVLLADIGITA